MIACAKGIERGTHKFMTEVIAESAPRALPAILSGPSFAADVARGLPTAVTLAARDEAIAAALARALGSATFRPYHSTDVRGVEIGGAAKNVLAIAAGIVAGRGLGASAAAALITRGFAELFRFGQRVRRAAGDADRPVRARRPDPDLLERAVAQLLARRRARRGQTPAGAPAASSPKAPSPRRCCVEMANEKGVEMPIAAAVAAVLGRQRSSVDEAIESAADAAVPREESGGDDDDAMAYWLLKTEPEDILLGRSGQARRQGRAVDRRAQLHRAAAT